MDGRADRQTDFCGASTNESEKERREKKKERERESEEACGVEERFGNSH